MKKLLLFTLIFFCSYSFSKNLYVEATYKDFSNKLIKKEWKVKPKDNTLNFFIDGKLKASLFINNGNVEKIVEYKMFSGKIRKFTITKPSQIKLELNGSFFPFKAVLKFLKGIKPQSDSRFKVREARLK